MPPDEGPASQWIDPRDPNDPSHVGSPSTLIEHAKIVHHDRITAEPLAFEDGRVIDVARTGAYRLDLRDHLVFPGLINAHDHLQLNSVPPLSHAAPFPNSYAWIDAFTAWRERADVIAAVSVPKRARHWQGGLKNLLAGTTTVAHHDPSHVVFDESGFPVGVLRDLGWSHSLGLGHSSTDAEPRYGPAVQESFAATPPGRPWIIHLAEGTDAIACAELDQLDALGCLDEHTVLVHGVGLTSEGVGHVIERGAAVVWCPASNLGMLGRTLALRDVRRLFDAGRLALGTDSRLTGSRDLLDELRVAASNSGLSAVELLRLVTTDARRVLRCGGCGGLAPGRRADCVIVRAGADPYRTLIDSERSAIRAVVRGGVPLVADPDFGDWFAHCGVETVAVRLDGVAKLVARAVLPDFVQELEPGLDLLPRADAGNSWGGGSAGSRGSAGSTLPNDLVVPRGA
jgi:cytosine/adenosine deaminase-related metal-dependent hydrolase